MITSSTAINTSDVAVSRSSCGPLGHDSSPQLACASAGVERTLLSTKGRLIAQVPGGRLRPSSRRALIKASGLELLTLDRC
jgi:hypothetical protein